MPSPTKRRTTRGAPQDPIEAEQQQGILDAQKELRLIMQGVPYSRFVDADPPLSVDLFLRLRNIVMMRRFFGDLSDAQVAARMELSLEKLAEAEASPHVSAMREALEDSAKKIAGIESLADMAKLFEGRVAKEQALLAVAGSSREKIKVLGDVADRVSPKKSRTGDGGGSPARVFPEDLLKLIEAGVKMGREFEAEKTRDPLESAKTIDASVLNVPGASEALARMRKHS